MKKHPIALSTWKQRVQEVQDLIRPRGLSRTAEALRDLRSGQLTTETAQQIQILAGTEAQLARIDPLMLWQLCSHVVGLMRDLAYLEVVDYCACAWGRRRFAEDSGAEVSDEDLMVCVACVDGVRKPVVDVGVIQ